MALETPTTAPHAAGDKAEDFTLKATNGQTYASRPARQNGLLLLALFKTGCGTCKFSAPYLQRFHEQYALPSGGKFQIWGVSQNMEEETLTFAREYGNLTFPLLLDADLDVTAAFGITHVPNLYLLNADDTIAASVIGHFGTEEFNALAEQIARGAGVPYTPIVKAEDNAPAIKPG